jgi:hypothetical protein
MLVGSLVRAAGKVGSPVIAPRLQSKRPGGKTTGLTFYAESGYTLVEGYRSLTLPLSPDFPGS